MLRMELIVVLLFFFSSRRRHTRFKCDWSSDVCSSDLVVVARIRERFEIQVVPPGWGRLPFLAVTDTSDHNLPRLAGRWGEAGFRLVEHAMGWPAGYYLWCWENPHPERPVERIEFIPRGRRFVVARITTSD